MMTQGEIRSILAATDLGPSSDRVVASAAVMAERAGAELHLVHALEIDNLPELDHPTFPGRIRQAEELLADQARRVAGRASPASMEVANSAAHRAVEAQAAAVRAEMIVLGPHRGGEVGAHFMGTTAESVIKGAEVPVMVARGALSPPLARVGVPTDFSDPSRHALDLALRLAGPLFGVGEGGGGELVVFHAGWSAEHESAAARQELESSLRTQVETALRRSATAVPVRMDIAWGVSPTDTVAAYAEKQGMELLVMGTHGHTGLRRMITGSVAAGVARQAACSVLLVPPHPGEAR